MADYKVTNPATGEVEAEFATLTDDQLRESLDRTAETFTSWSESELSERAQLLRRAAELYEERKDKLAEIITREMGKPVKQARSELDIVISIFNYYADHGAEFLQDEEITDAPDGRAFMQSEPVGVLLGIMPWNFPYYQVARFAAPNLMIGNTILLKHASQCPESAAAIEEIFHDAGFPKNAYTNVYVSSQQIAEIVIPDPRVQASRSPGLSGPAPRSPPPRGRTSRRSSSSSAATTRCWCWIARSCPRRSRAPSPVGWPTPDRPATPPSG